MAKQTADEPTKTAEQRLRWLSEPRALREAEPVLGAFVRETPLEAAQRLSQVLRSLESDNDDPQRLRLRRAGYALSLLGYFSPRSGWTHRIGDAVRRASNHVPSNAPLASFYELGPLNHCNDQALNRWRLGSGTPYDRLKRLLRPPYAC